MQQLMIFFEVCIDIETSIFIMAKVISATSSNICCFLPTDFAYVL